MPNGSLKTSAHLLALKLSIIIAWAATCGRMVLQSSIAIVRISLFGIPAGFQVLLLRVSSLGCKLSLSLMLTGLIWDQISPEGTPVVVSNGVLLRIHSSTGCWPMMCCSMILLTRSGETSEYQIPSGQTRRIGPRSHTLRQSALLRRTIPSGRSVFSRFSSRTTLFS